MTNSNARDKFLALIRQNGWVNDPTAKISQGRYREEEWVQDPYTSSDWLLMESHHKRWRYLKCQPPPSSS